MGFIVHTKHLVVFLVVLVTVLSVSVYRISSPTTNASSVVLGVSVPPEEDIRVEALSTHLDASERSLVRERIARAVESRVPEPVVPSLEVSDEDVPPQEDESNTSEAVTIASSVKFCTSRADRVAGTYSPQGVTTVVRAEGARVVSLTSGDVGVLGGHTFQLPEIPSFMDHEQCIDDTIVGIGLDGRLIYAGIPFTSTREGLLGYARDGFGIFAPEENGGIIKTADLDQCHGHTHEVVWDGVPMVLYHYHSTDDAPYTVSCYQGIPTEG